MPLFGPPRVKRLKTKCDVKGLIKALGYKKSYGIRRDAVEALVQIGAPAVEPLIAALKDNDEDTRQAAAEALDQLGWQPDQSESGAVYWIMKQRWKKCTSIGAPAVEPLIAVLRDYKDPAVLRAVARTLGQIGDARAVKPLISRLKDTDWHMQGVPEAIAKALVQIGAPGVETLITALNDDDWHVSSVATETLGRIGDDRAVEPLIVALESGWRRKAAKALGQIGDARAVDALIAALEDDDLDVRKIAVKALGQIGGERAASALSSVLGDDNSEVRDAAARALGQMDGEHAVEPLIVALNDSNSRVRKTSAEMLGRFGADAIGPLVNTLKDRSLGVRTAAIEALDQLGWQPSRDEGGAAYWIVKRRWDECVDIGAPAVNLLAAALNDKNKDVRKGAIRALGRIGSPHAVESLITALKNNDSDVRDAVVEALGQMNDEHAVETLIVVLKDGELWARTAAAKALGQIGEECAVSSLITALKDRSEDVRKGAAEALGQIGDECAVKPLIAVLRNSDRRMQMAAAEALGQIGDERAVGSLIDVLKDHEDVYVLQTSAEALGQIGGERAASALIAVLRDSNRRMQKAAAKALGQMDGEHAVEPLIAALDSKDWEMRYSAAKALGAIGESAIDSLVIVLENKVGAVRDAAIKALGEIGNGRAVEILGTLLSDEQVQKAAAGALGSAARTNVSARSHLVETLMKGSAIQSTIAEELISIGWRPETLLSWQRLHTAREKVRSCHDNEMCERVVRMLLRSESSTAARQKIEELLEQSRYSSPEYMYCSCGYPVEGGEDKILEELLDYDCTDVYRPYAQVVKTSYYCPFCGSHVLTSEPPEYEFDEGKVNRYYLHKS